MIAVVSPSSTSTSGRATVGMKPCRKALYVSLISRCDSAAIVPNTSELLPDPEMPVNTVCRRFGISTLTSLRLFTRAPRTRIRSWLSAACTAAHLSARGRERRRYGRRSLHGSAAAVTAAVVVSAAGVSTPAPAVAAVVRVGVDGLAGRGGGRVDAVVVAPEDVVQVGARRRRRVEVGLEIGQQQRRGGHGVDRRDLRVCGRSGEGGGGEQDSCGSGQAAEHVG